MSAIIWNVDPVLMSLGAVSIRWYSVWTAAGLIAGHHVFRHIWQKEGRRAVEADLVVVVAVFFSVLGARLAHCFFYQPDYYLAHPLDILKLWQGGLASHGGFLGLFCGLALLLRVCPNLSFLQLADRFMISAAIVSVSLRLGNLFNSEIYGKPSDVPWAFVFARVDQMPRHPSQVYEILFYILILVVLVMIYTQPKLRAKPGVLLGSALVLYPAFRVVTEISKESQTHLDQTWLLTMGQLLSLPFGCLGILLLFGVQRYAPAWFSGAFDLRDVESRSP